MRRAAPRSSGWTNEIGMLLMATVLLIPEKVNTKLLAKSAISWPPAAKLRVKRSSEDVVSVFSSVALEPNWVNSVLLVPIQWQANSKRLSVRLRADSETVSRAVGYSRRLSQ